MACKTYRELGLANDAATTGFSPNDHQSNIIATKEASVAAAKAKKDAENRAAAEFKAKAANDAQDLEACRAEIISLKSRLREAQRTAAISSTQADQAKSTADVLQRDFTAKKNELLAAEAEIQRLTSQSSDLRNQVSGLTASNRELQSQRDRNANDRDRYSAELARRVAELDNGDVTIREIKWGERDYSNDGNVVNRVKERVRNGSPLPFNNTFFGDDPRPGERKYAVVRFCRSRRVEGWEFEEKHSMP